MQQPSDAFEENDMGDSTHQCGVIHSDGNHEQHLQKPNQQPFSQGLSGIEIICNQENHNRTQSEFSMLINFDPTTKSKIVHKIRQIMARKNPTSINNQQILSIQSKFNIIPANQERTNEITRQKLMEIKKAFDSYRQAVLNSEKGQPTLTNIGQNLNLTMADVQTLYGQYNNDPSFTNRINQIDAQSRFGGKCDNKSLTEQRVQFLRELIKNRGPLTENEILAEMNKVNSLHMFIKGKMLPISRTVVQSIMKLSHVLPRLIPSFQRIPSSRQTIKNRYSYSRRYLQLTDDKNAQICFIGQYSYCNLISLSSCPVNKREFFVNYLNSRGGRRIKAASKEEDAVVDKWGRNSQILVAMSLHGIVHYQIFTNIFEECNFLRTVLTIANQMKIRRPHHNKYLILETSFFHSKQALRRMEKLMPVKTVFLPPQTPMLNPTEYFFNELKQLIKSKAYKQHRGYGPIATELLKSMRNKNMQNYFMCIRPYLQLSLSQQSFK